MKTFLTISILLAASIVRSQNKQSYTYMLNDKVDLTKDTISELENIFDLSKLFEKIEQQNKTGSDASGLTQLEQDKQNIRDSFNFEMLKNSKLNDLHTLKSAIRENLRKVFILEAAWLKMNNLNPEQNTPMYADIMEMKSVLLEADSETIGEIKNLRNKKFGDSINFSISYLFDEKKYNEVKNSLNDGYKAYAKSKTTQDINAATIPQISTINSKFNPTISLLGATEISKNGRYKLEFFTGNGTIDTVSIATILVPELSKYGIRLNGLKDLNKRLGINGDLHYHEKKSFITKENADFSFSRIQAKFGIECLIFKHILSIYANYNYIIPVTNSEKYKELFAPKRKDQQYMDVGLKLFLTPKGDLAKNSGVGLFIDLNFINTTEAVKILNGNNDAFIPNIKFGLQKNFR